MLGFVAGVALSLGGMRLIQSLLYDVRVRDVGLFSATIAVVSASAAIAIYLPARRAATTDPVRLLRST
ncbi:MAG TPA: hypothetical protein VGM82_17550 [Gemmatimonadaceae bacterium]